jgi:hypothetical protein
MNQKINWNLELLQKYKDHWDWGFLSKNESIIFNEEIIGSFENKWDWRELCCNKGVKWDSRLIEKYRYGIQTHAKLNNEKYEFLIFKTTYEHYVIDDMIDDMIDDFTLIKGLDSNPSVRFDELLVNKYFDKWNLDSLLNNHSVQWTKNLLLRVINSIELYDDVEKDDEGKFFGWIEVEPDEDFYPECTHFFSSSEGRIVEISKNETNLDLIEGEVRFLKDYNPEKELQYEKLGYNFIKSIWELIFKDYADFYGIDRLLNLNNLTKPN